MQLKELNITYIKGRPPKIKEGHILLPYLNPDYLRNGSAPEYFPLQPAVVLVDMNDILLLWDGSNAGEFLKGKEGMLASTMVKFNKINDIDATYFYYSLKLQEPLLKSKTSGSGIPHVDKEVLLNLSIFLPDKDRQLTIASVLVTIDEAIQKTTQLIAKYKRVKVGLMQDLLTCGIDENGNIRSEETHEFKHSPLGRIPSDWEVIELEQLVESDSPIVYGILMPGYGHDNGIPVIKVKDITNDEIKQDNLLLTSPEIAAAYERSKLESGDLLFTIRGTVGRCAFVPKILQGANITQDTARLRIKAINPKFVRQYFEMPLSKAYIELHTIGLAVKGINLRDLRKLLVVKPSKDESDRIVERLHLVESFIAIESDGLNKLMSQKMALMQDLLTGKVRVDALINQPAEIV